MRMTLCETLALCKADIERKLYLENKKNSVLNISISLFRRSVILVTLYRFKRYFYLKNTLIFKVLLRLLKYPEYHFCHCEIDPRAEIGTGLVVGNCGGLSLGYSVIIGKNCTFMGKATPTLGAMEDIDIQTDRIRIGDDCIIGHNVKIINPVTIANGVQIKSNSVLMTSIKIEGALVSGFPAKKIDVLSLDAIKTWSPFLSRNLAEQAV